jgi:inhibitor of growth protein 3
MDGRFKSFFALAKKNKPEWREEQFKQITDEYKKILDEADEKVVLADQLHELVERYLKKLDIELGKFKLELEADSAGITEMLEQRSLLLDQTPVPSPVNQPMHSGHGHHHPHKRKVSNLDDHYTRGHSFRNYSSSPPSPNGGGSLPYYNSAYNGYSQQHPSKMARSSSYAGNVSQDEVGAVTASPQQHSSVPQHVLAQDSRGGRGSGTLKISYPNQGGTSGFITSASPQIETARSHSIVGTIGSMSATVTAATAIVPIGTADTKQQSRKKTSRTVTSSSIEYAVSNSAPTTPSGTYPTPEVSTNNPNTVTAIPTGSADTGARVPDGTIPVSDVPTGASWYDDIDPNEPKYCICNQYSYGEMVACDNNECPIEWFHYGCVNITEPPKGKWYCPQCNTTLNKRRRYRPG